VSLRTRYLIIFAGEAIGCLIAISLLWHFLVASHYNHLLVWIADRLSSSRIALGDGSDNIYFYFSDRQAWIYGSSLHYGLLLVVALMVATPGLKLRQRLKFIPLALLIMFVIHIVTILIFDRVARSSSPAHPMNENPWIILFLVVGCDLFPALIWGILSYRYWFPKLKVAPARGDNLKTKSELRKRRAGHNRVD
jgi:hypothetical protein